jgi:hypothetical protein
MKSTPRSGAPLFILTWIDILKYVFTQLLFVLIISPIHWWHLAESIYFIFMDVHQCLHMTIQTSAVWESGVRLLLLTRKAVCLNEICYDDRSSCSFHCFTDPIKGIRFLEQLCRESPIIKLYWSTPLSLKQRKASVGKSSNQFSLLYAGQAYTFIPFFTPKATEPPSQCK